MWVRVQRSKKEFLLTGARIGTRCRSKSNGRYKDQQFRVHVLFFYNCICVGLRWVCMMKKGGRWSDFLVRGATLLGSGIMISVKKLNASEIERERINRERERKTGRARERGHGDNEMLGKRKFRFRESECESRKHSAKSPWNSETSRWYFLNTQLKERFHIHELCTYRNRIFVRFYVRVMFEEWVDWKNFRNSVEWIQRIRETQKIEVSVGFSYCILSVSLSTSSDDSLAPIRKLKTRKLKNYTDNVDNQIIMYQVEQTLGRTIRWKGWSFDGEI